MKQRRSRRPGDLLGRMMCMQERTESMLPPKKMRDLARSLVDRETDPTNSLHTEPATMRVYERLRRQLGAPVGVDGFQALASRALALAKAESPRLSVVQMMANGGLHGLDELDSLTDADEDGEAGILLIAQLLGLFLTFLGEATTLRLLEDLRLQGELGAESATIAENKNSSAADESHMAEAFEDLLVEIDRLRSVSEHIEALAAAHPGMEDGLVSVAGSIRNIATVLDVFTLIRSRAGGPQDELPNLQTNRYMN
jgi:hypothetical protein